MRRMRSSWILLMLAASAVFSCAWAGLNGPQMPRIEGATLAGRSVMLPDAAAGKTAILVFGFTKASRGPTTAWGKRIDEKFGSAPEVVWYELPVLESVPRLIRGMVISSIKNDTPENLRDHFVPVLHREAESKKFVNYDAHDDAYIVVLDSHGNLRYQIHGAWSEAAYAQLQKALDELLQQK